jgi:ribokinase
MTKPVLTPGEAHALRQAAAHARVLVVGSLNVDLILRADGEPEDEGAVLVHEESTQAGGHAGNCAAALAALGVRVAVAGAVGADDDGQSLLVDLRDRGVDTALVRRADRPTGRVVIPVFGTKHYMLLCRGANDSFGAADLREVLRADRYDAVLVFDPAREALPGVGAALSGLAVPPLLGWTPGGIFSADPVAADVLPHCDMVFANAVEHRQLNDRAKALDVLRPDAELVVTLGEGGSVLYQAGQELRVPVERVAVVDPTGAGDAFTAAYLLARLAGLAPETRLALANAGGARAVTVVGARSAPAALTDLFDHAAG